MPVYKFRIRTSEAIVSNKYQWLTPFNLSELPNVGLSKRKISVSQISAMVTKGVDTGPPQGVFQLFSISVKTSYTILCQCLNKFQLAWSQLTHCIDLWPAGLLPASSLEPGLAPTSWYCYISLLPTQLQLKKNLKGNLKDI